jgi:hypothetical protein
MSTSTIPQNRAPEKPPSAIAQLIERVCREDRLYFERHPDADERVRPYVAGELWPLDADGAPPLLILVKPVAPGVRARIPIIITDFRVVEDDSDRRLPL